jgi:NTE family protein
LLEEDSLAFDAISGASAGAVNAVVLASGLASGGRREAQKQLEWFWKQASDAAPRARVGAAVALTSHVVSPYEFNPFNLNPLRTLLSEQINFDLLRAKPSVRLLIATTRVRDGALPLFREKALDVDVVLASACLPHVHHAVSIAGEAYWDGGYAAKPPLIPLVSATRALEVLVVQIMPSAGLSKPTTSSEISRRLDQITFNGTLTRDLDALAAMKKLASPRGHGLPLARKLRGLQLHHIAAETQVPELSRASGMNLDWDFLVELRDAGGAAAHGWLEQAA